ncbi:MAG: hypothetical protein ACYS26_12610 [Planctomycetota bacterium]|jgi:hypothetical protein
MDAAFRQALDEARDAKVADWERLAREWWSEGFAEAAARVLLAARAGELRVISSWMLKRALEEELPLEGRLRGRLARGADADWPWEARLHVLQCVHRLPWTRAQGAALLPFAESGCEDAAPFVRAWGANAVAHLQLCVLGDQQAALASLERAEQDPQAAVRARARGFRRDHARALART